MDSVDSLTGVEAVEDAINRFYAGGERDLHNALLQFQASPQAWTLVWPLLGPTKSWNVKFFAATTLHSKILKQWDEIPVSDYPFLKNELLKIIISPSTPKLTAAKLYEAFAAFLSNYYSTEDKNDDNDKKELMDDLLGMLPYNNPETLDILLRVFSALLLDVEKRMGAKRTKLRQQLGLNENQSENWSKSTWLLKQVFTSYVETIGEEENFFYLALEGALPWIRMNPPLDSINQLFEHFLIAAAHYAPRTDEFEDETHGWELARDILLHIMGQDTLLKRPALFWEWARGIVSLAQQNGSIHFLSILASLGDTHTRTLLLALVGESDESRRWTVETLIQLLLTCSEYPGRYATEERYSSIPLGFWFSLQDNISTLDPPIDNQVRLALKPIYVRLVHVQLQKMTLPLSAEEAGTDEESEIFRCYRQDIADNMTYCYNIIGRDLLIILGQRLSQPLIDTLKWVDVEATLYSFQALSDCVETTDTECVPALMDLIISRISYDKYPEEVLACACSTIAAYAEWLGENPEPWLERSLQLITYSLTQRSTVLARATMALKDITRECQTHLATLAPSILDTIGKTLTVLPAGSNEGLRLMYAAGKLINSLRTTEEQLQYLDATLGQCVMKLRELLQHPVPAIQENVTKQLKMATMFLSTLEGAMGKSVLDGLMPTFNQIVAHPELNQNDQILDAMYNCAQRSLQCLLHPENDARPLLTLLVTAYRIRPHPAALQLLRQVVVLFGSDSNNAMGPIFAEIGGHTLSGFNACKLAGGNLSDFGELLEAYLGLLGQICKKTPKLMLQVPDHIPEMLRCGIIALGLPETAVIKAAGTFLMHAIAQSNHLSTFIEAIGQELVCMILECIGGKVARSNLEHHTKVLHALNNYYKHNVGAWIRSALEDGVLISLTPSQKESLTRSILAERNKGRLDDMLQKFSLEYSKPIVGL
ncbi:importin-13 [Microplitis mediator]|uniref:importin-13 n=1 Tax=Microplitis mediator TaxID=375433 RepID=UPI002553EA0D|nr:importin-13 [Microplitis mediator]